MLYLFSIHIAHRERVQELVGHPILGVTTELHSKFSLNNLILKKTRCSLGVVVSTFVL